MHLAELLQHANLTPQGPLDPRAEVLGITEDSRLVRPGWVFIARPGLRSDGRRFIPDAIAAGAIAILTDAPPEPTDPHAGPLPLICTPDPALAGSIMAEALAGAPSSNLKLVGVTGTNGKSTITSLLSQLANQAHLRCGLIGTVEIDDGSGTVPSDFTTPPAERLSTLIGRMVDNNCDAAAIEVSSHALDQHRVSGLSFAAAVFTNLTGDHLDYHKDMASYAAAKARLFSALAPDSIAVVNADDPASRRMLEDCPATLYRCTLATGPPTARLPRRPPQPQRRGPPHRHPRHARPPRRRVGHHRDPDHAPRPPQRDEPAPGGGRRRTHPRTQPRDHRRRRPPRAPARRTPRARRHRPRRCHRLHRLRTHRRRGSPPPSAPPGSRHLRTPRSGPSSAAAETRTAPSAPAWASLPRRSPTTPSSPATTPAPKTRTRSSTRSSPASPPTAKTPSAATPTAVPRSSPPSPTPPPATSSSSPARGTSASRSSPTARAAPAPSPSTTTRSPAKPCARRAAATGSPRPVNGGVA
ncbi:MAG: hypothetical protein HND58_05595 [Planctomycetota bacterium]|nr:MAG: hypothetical protein HND58_05595 [Planctomycetota bacterium]